MRLNLTTGHVFFLLSEAGEHYAQQMFDRGDIAIDESVTAASEAEIDATVKLLSAVIQHLKHKGCSAR